MKSYQRNNLGGGILTLSIIQLVFYGLGILGLLFSIVMKDAIQIQLQSMGQNVPDTPTSQLIINMLLSIIIVIGIILILLKKTIGIYIYFAGAIVNIIYSTIMTGFGFGILLSLIFPGLMAVFILKKKQLFGFDKDEEELIE